MFLKKYTIANQTEFLLHLKDLDARFFNWHNFCFIGA